MSFWRKTKTRTEVATTPTSELDQRIKELMRRDGPKMRNWSWELHAALEERRTSRQLREMEANVKLAKGELELGQLAVDWLHEKVDEDNLRMVRDGQTAYVPKRRRG